MVEKPSGNGGKAAANDGSKPATDWEAIEREYRAGQISVHQIARENAVSHTAINKRAKRDGWTRDLSGKVRQEVSARLVSSEVSTIHPREAIEAAAQRGVALVREHRQDIGTNRSAVTKLISELHSTIEHIDEIEDAIEDETAGDKDGKRRARMLAAVALPSRAAIANSLAQALKTLIPLERQAFNLDERGAPPDGAEAQASTAADELFTRISRLAARSGETRRDH